MLQPTHVSQDCKMGQDVQGIDQIGGKVVVWLGEGTPGRLLARAFCGRRGLRTPAHCSGKSWRIFAPAWMQAAANQVGSGALDGNVRAQFDPGHDALLADRMDESCL
jgi:hypothetical protein